MIIQKRLADYRFRVTLLPRRMTASPQPQIRTVHQLQNMLSLFWKNANYTYKKIPSGYITGLFKSKKLKIFSKRSLNVPEFTRLISAMNFRWKSPVLLQPNTTKKIDLDILKSEDTTCTKKTESPHVIELDKQLTEWMNEDEKPINFPQSTTMPMDTATSKSVFTIKNNLERVFSRWFQFQVMKNNRTFAQKDENSLTTPYKGTKISIEVRSRFLVKSLLSATSESSLLYRLHEIGKHLLKYPDQKNVMVKERAIPVTLKIRQSSNNSVQAAAQETLSLLGYTDPPGGAGIRILSIDGGGVRGMIAIEILRHLENTSGKPIHQLFDYICGVSTGAILTVLVGGLHLPLNECERLYLKMSNELFKRSAFLGTSGLLWSQSYYDTSMWVNMLKNTYGELNMITTNNKKGNPKISSVSAVTNQPILEAFAFRNYALPHRKYSLYPGSCNHKLWQAIRASAAAPGYFEQYSLDGLVHQDGGLVMNNPTPLAVHEAKLLWPKEKIQCVLSLGNGRFIPPPEKVANAASTGLTTVMMKVIDSATDTESFHAVLQDHLPSNVYFRINPYMTERITLDEIRTEKLELLKKDAKKYISWNEDKIRQVVQAVTKPRSHLQKISDWITLNSTLYQRK